MKRLVSLLIAGFFSFHLVLAQKVDNIRAEQSGDFIKIRYKILNSKPGEVYRVSVLCSINGGMKTELESISGDAGDQVPGGKPEYWVIWDVLKDVDDLKSADFIVRAELLKALPGKEATVDKTAEKAVNSSNSLNSDLWTKKRFNVLLSFMGPGPKSGFRFGYIGNWGLSMQVLSGKTEKGDANYEAPNSLFYSADVTKRIVNQKNFQMHVFLGVANSSLVFLNPDFPAKPFSLESVAGPEIGLIGGISRLAFSFTVTNFDQGQIEKGTDIMGISPSAYFSFGLGIRF